MWTNGTMAFWGNGLCRLVAMNSLFLLFILMAGPWTAAAADDESSSTARQHRMNRRHMRGNNASIRSRCPSLLLEPATPSPNSRSESQHDNELSADISMVTSPSLSPDSVKQRDVVSKFLKQRRSRHSTGAPRRHQQPTGNRFETAQRRNTRRSSPSSLLTIISSERRRAKDNVVGGTSSNWPMSLSTGESSADFLADIEGKIRRLQADRIAKERARLRRVRRRHKNHKLRRQSHANNDSRTESRGDVAAAEQHSTTLPGPLAASRGQRQPHQSYHISSHQANDDFDGQWRPRRWRAMTAAVNEDGGQVGNRWNFLAVVSSSTTSSVPVTGHVRRIVDRGVNQEQNTPRLLVG